MDRIDRIREIEKQTWTKRGRRGGPQDTRAKLSDDQVRRLRHTYLHGPRGAIGRLALEFGVCYATAWKAARGESYLHVDPETNPLGHPNFRRRS